MSDEHMLEAFAEEFGKPPPTRWVVCYGCNGRAVMTLKRLAVTQEQFEEDPDFKEDYLNGVYDEPCPDCHGRSTVLEIDVESLPPEQERWVEDYIREESEYRQLVEMERRMGC